LAPGIATVCRDPPLDSKQGGMLAVLAGAGQEFLLRQLDLTPCELMGACVIPDEMPTITANDLKPLVSQASEDVLLDRLVLPPLLTNRI
jgi:hypothetical protein